jgi:hypothetical protein
LRVIRSRQQRCESRAFCLQQPRAGTEHNAPFAGVFAVPRRAETVLRGRRRPKCSRTVC